MKSKVCLSDKMQQLEVRNTAIDDFVTLLTRSPLLPDNFNVVVIVGFTLMIVATISIILQRLSAHKRTRYLGNFEDDWEDLNFRSRSNSIDELSVKRDGGSNDEKYPNELYLAADKCYIKKYAERCRRLVDYYPHLINVKFGPTGQTPFHRVCFHGKASLIQFMLAKGANPHLITDAGECPICLAIHYYVNKKNYLEVESTSCLDILQRAGCSLGENSIWYDILLKMTMRAGNKSLTEWLLTNGRYGIRPRTESQKSGQSSGGSSCVVIFEKSLRS